MIRQHAFFALVNEEYISHPDFYRYCTEHKVGRTTLQKGMNTVPIHVISNGKHKGECFAWTDVGADAMRAARTLSVATVHETRSKAVEAVHAQNEYRSYQRTEIELLDPEGKLRSFNTLVEAEVIGPSTTLQNVKNKLPHTFMNGPWAGWTLQKYITSIR